VVAVYAVEAPQVRLSMCPVLQEDLHVGEKVGLDETRLFDNQLRDGQIRPPADVDCILGPVDGRHEDGFTQ
jgi:hypothetical protein